MTTSSGFLDQSQREMLASALNRLIPPSGAMPGAGDLGLAAFVEGAVGGKPRQRRLFTDGLAQLEIAASRQGGSGFGQLEGETQDAVLREIQSQTPVFFDALFRQCYNGYYTNPQVLELNRLPDSVAGDLRLPTPGRNSAGAPTATGSLLDPGITKSRAVG